MNFYRLVHSEYMNRIYGFDDLLSFLSITAFSLFIIILPW